MATFHGGKFGGQSKESKLDDSPYHIFTPEDPNTREDIPSTFSTFHPPPGEKKDPFTDIADSFAQGSPLHYQPTFNTYEDSPNAPRHGSHGSNAKKVFSPRLAQRNRSIDNVTECGLRILPPRGQYHSPNITSTSSFTKTLPPRRMQHQGSLSKAGAMLMPAIPRHGSVPSAGEHLSSSMPLHRLAVPSPWRGNPCSQRRDTMDDIGQPLGDNLSQEYDKLEPNETDTGASMVQRNTAYESVVRRPFNNSGQNSPLFDIEVELDQDFNVHGQPISKPQIYGSETNFFDMSSEEGSRSDLSLLQPNDKLRMLKASSYENVTEYYIPDVETTEEGATVATQSETKGYQVSTMEDKGRRDSVERGSEREASISPQRSQLKPDYENVKDYTGTPAKTVDDGAAQEWIPLAAVSSLITHSDNEATRSPQWNPVPPPPTIVIQSEEPSSTEDEPQPKVPERSGPTTSRSMGHHKSIETISDYEEMVSSFSSQCYTAIRGNQQQSFPFLSSLELPGAAETEQQTQDDKHGPLTSNPTGDTQQHSAQLSPCLPSDKQAAAPKRKIINCCFQYCLILIMLAIAIPALVLSTMNYLKLK